jgi:hypothetical protein
MTTGAVASEQGMAAADEVSEASYYDLLYNWLYTHAGDNRGFGAEHDLARDNIVMFMESYGLDVVLEPFQYSGNTYYNVVGTKLGTTYPDQEYIVGAHIDSVDNPGADDNGSGTALVLEAARVLSQYDSAYTIRFIGFDREEQGLIGSYAYVDAHIGDDILGMISTDMVAYNDGQNMSSIFGRSASAPFKNALAAAVAEYGDGLNHTVQGPLNASDHAPFESAGFQACLFIERDPYANPYYHSQQDNVDEPNYIDYAFASRLTRSVVGLFVDLAEVAVPVDTLVFTLPDGVPEFVDPAGGTTIRVEVAGLGTEVPEPGSGLLHYDTGAGWQSVPMSVVSPDVYDAVLPPATCPDEVLFYFSADSVSGQTYTEPRDAPEDSYSAIAADGWIVFFQDDFETDLGWTVVDSPDLITGTWERGVPAGGGDRGDPAQDSDGSGQCYVTGLADGDNDIDNGSTTLYSPVMDATDPEAVLSYDRWYSNTSGADPANDIFVVDVSDNGGSTWENLEIVGPSGPEVSGGWYHKEFLVADIPNISNTSQLRIRFTASDLNAGSVVEAGVDAIEVSSLLCDEPDCPADIDGDGTVGIGDLLGLLAAWGPCPGCPADIDGDDIVGISDLLALLAAWGPCPG